MCFLCSYDYLTSSKKKIEKKKCSDPYDVIIVPGVPFEDPNFELVLKARMLWAKYLYENKIAKNIIFSGSSVYSPYVESKIMRIYADSIGIPSEHTFSETQAEHSTENVYYSVLLAKKLGFKKIAVATDPYQALILRKYIQKKFPAVEIIKIDYAKIHVLRSSWPKIEPCSAYVNDFVSIIDREDRMHRFKGTLGKNINFDDSDSTYCNEEIPPSAIAVR
jgi:hypothetical protein